MYHLITIYLRGKMKTVHETLPDSMYMPLQQYIQTVTSGLIEQG